MKRLEFQDSNVLDLAECLGKSTPPIKKRSKRKK